MFWPPSWNLGATRGDLAGTGEVRSAVEDAPTCLQGLDCLELASAIGSAGAEAAEPTIVDAHEPGGGWVVGQKRRGLRLRRVELIGMAERATTAEPEALEAWHGLHVAPRNDVAKGKQAVRALPPPGDAHAHGRDEVPRHGATECRRECDMVSQEGTREGEHICKSLPKGRD